MKFGLLADQLGTLSITLQCPGCARFAEIASELIKTWSSGVTEF